MKRTASLSQACVLLLASACAATPPPPAAVAAAPPPAAAASAAKPSAESLTIEFVSGGSTLSQAALAQLDGAARLYRDAQPEVMIVAGHTDKVGPEFPNLLLSARRAASVKRALVERGVPAERLQIIAYGEAEPAPSAMASRAVVVTWR